MKKKEFLGGSFGDDKGNRWKYCVGKCTTKKQVITDTTGRRVEIMPISKITPACTCKCVLFDMSGDGPPKLISEGGWVTVDPKADYSSRCVEKV